MIKPEVQKKAYFNEKSIIKWYQVTYDNGEKKENIDEAASDNGISNEDISSDGIQNESAGGSISDEPTGGPGGDSSGNSELDDEVARIMAAFRGAQQNSVDSVLSNFESAETASAELSEEELVAQICGTKQSSVDELFKSSGN